MKKGKRAGRKRRTVILACAMVLLLAGCGARQKEEAQISPERNDLMQGLAETADAESGTGQENAADTEMPVPEQEAVLDSANAESAASDMENTENAEKAQALYQARIRHYYGGILSQISANGQLSDGKGGTQTLEEESYGKAEDNCFAIADIDQDGREELLIKWTTTYTAGMFEAVYDYDPVLGKLKEELRSFPTHTFYENGVLKEEWSHNQGPGELWPFSLYRHDAESDSYVEIGSVDTWDKAYRETWYDGQPFPDERDTDGDGILYHICKEGEACSHGYEAYRYNKTDFDEWWGEIVGDAREIPMAYLPIAYESFADFAPVYLKLLAEEAGEKRTDTASDLGLFVLKEPDFLEAAQRFLAENHEIELKQPDPDFTEWTVGCKDGREIFSFEALNAGHIGYQGERVGDVTIFGIYPGISVDGAWEKLKAYGFYASPYGEVENCLITGEGFGNISIWFSAEDGFVTDITAGPYCAFAG